MNVSNSEDNKTKGSLSLTTASETLNIILSIKMVKVAWSRLIRFVATDGRTLRGEPILPSEDFDLGNVTEADELQAKVIIGDDIFDTTGKTFVTNEIVGVKKVLGPLAASEIPILRCVGLNYAKHSAYHRGPFEVLPESPSTFLTVVKSRKLEGLLHHFHLFSSSQTQQLSTTRRRL